MSNKKENQKDELESCETEVPEFIPTREEMLEIAKYWYQEYLSDQWLWFFCSVSSAGPGAYRWGRIARIGELLGEEEVGKILDQTWEEFLERSAPSVDPKHLDIFLHGDAEQMEVARKEIAEEEHQLWLKEKEDLRT